MWRPDFLAQIKGCLSLTCVEARSCIRAVYDGVGCDN
jgi:hypothetical protein